MSLEARTGPVAEGAALNVVWRHPAYVVAVALVVAACVFNLARGNMLWTWYNAVGLLLVLGVAWADQAHWRLPARVRWWALLPFAMHQVGGSLSGVHAIGGPNGLYWMLPWWDNVVHFLGCGGVAVAAAHIIHGRTQATRAMTWVLATMAGLSIGVLVELYEFLGFWWFQTIDQGYYTNTMLDLYYNLLGAGAFAWAFLAGTGPGAAVDEAA